MFFRCLLAIGAVSALALPRSYGDEKISFNKDIRPILSDACFQCHGPDEAKRKGGLRLDLRESATAKLESDSTAIVPKKVSESELVKRILSNDSELRMPPDNIGKKLTQAQIDLLKKWIESGAEYQDHWAFRPVEKPKVPAAIHPVDAFIQDRLTLLKLSQKPEASRETLLRRVTIDLTGLPPTIQELDDFLADKSPNAYEKVIDRLLMSPRYGEHMAQQWLDFARYADSNGFQTDSSRNQWPWRDWVIKAFNTNKPFDEFTVEQIAGDLLPNARKDQIVATGFNRNHRLNGEGGLIAEEWRIETVIDRVETTGSTWLGLTFNCCRCHDHKYDPISQKEFYQFFAFFNNNTESGTLQGNRGGGNTDPTIALPSADQERELAKLDQEKKTIEAKLAELNKEVPKWQAEWETDFREKLKTDTSAWRVLAPKTVKSTAKTKLTVQVDGSYLAGGKNPPKDTYEIIAPLEAGSFSGLLLEVFTDPSLPEKSVGRNSNGNFALSAITAEISAAGVSKAPISVKFAKAEADYSQPGYDAANLLGSDRKKGWAVNGTTRKENNKVMVVADKPIDVPANATITIRLIQETLPSHNIGRFRLSASSAPIAKLGLNGQQVPELVRKALELAPEKRNEKQAAELRKYFLANAPSPIKDVEKQLAALNTQQKAIEAKFPNVMVMKEMPIPRDAHILLRGEYDKKGAKVTASLPSALPAPKPGEPMNRLGLARWLVQVNNPLTARVWVNRAWERFFGTGLVKTSENMGSQAEYPSHPELLDWLASEFMKPTNLPAVAGKPAHAWDMKAMHKLLVMSATYRQSAAVTKELLEVDPDNRLLARGPRFRLGAEVLRDQSLYLGGLLVEKIGGPSVRPYMPEGVWDETSRYGDLRGYKPDAGEGLYRRTMYTIWKRTAAPPSMLIFDAPSREYCTVKRSRTNTPLQALSLLNEVTYVEASRKFAERIVAEGGTTATERLRYGFRLATSRVPTADEEKILLEGWNADLAKYRKNPAAAAELLKFGSSPAGKNFDPAELAAYTLTANVLLNLDEVVTR